MNDKLKKVLNILVKVLTWALVAFTVFMMIFTIVTVATVDKNERSIFGFKFYIVQSDSMSKSDKNADMKVHFNAGDMIVVQNVKDPKALNKGDIISFMSTNKDSYGETITHMIYDVEKDDEGRVVGYVTFGTNTGAIDEELVKPEFVLGKYATKLPIVGHFFAFVKSVPGYIVCILVPFLLLILYNGANVIQLFRKYKKEQTAAMDAERQQLEQERAENQRMMAELLELKAQLMKKGEEEASPAEKKTATDTTSDAAESEESSDENKSDDSDDK